ncbi:MAG TPA: hypothetical protein VF158_00720, partial [Longimicrobiales bacterium]
MTIHPESILFWAGTGALARYGTLVRRTTPDAPAPAFQRAGPATFFGRDGRARQAAAGRPRVESLDLDGDGVREAGVLLLEAGRGNVLFDSSNFAPAGTAWTGEASFTLEPVASLIDGQTAYKHTNLGASSFRSRSQLRGVFTGSPETFYAIIENVDATESALSIFDDATDTHVCRARLVWSTGAASVALGSGSVYAERLAATGPNGGPVWLLAVTAAGTAGNARMAVLYPTGVGTNTQSAIIHHAQYEEAPFHSSPIVTTASAGATRAADGFVQPFGHAPQAMTLYVRFVDLGTGLGGGSQGVFYIGDAARAGLP